MRDIAVRPDRDYGAKSRFDQMIVKLTYAERDTILAALRRWQSFPAAREADSIATGGGKHRPLDNAEIDRICKRMTKTERKRDAAPLLRQSDNGAHHGANGTRGGSRLRKVTETSLSSAFKGAEGKRHGTQ